MDNNKLFYNDNDYNFLVNELDNYLKEYLNSYIFLYRLDKAKQGKSNLYGEVKQKDKVFLPKVQLSSRYELKNPQTKYEDSGFIYKEDIQLSFSVLERNLISLGIDITIGDYIKIYDGAFNNQPKIFEVSKVQNINTDTKSTKNYKPFFKTYLALLVRDDSVNKHLLNDFE